MCITSINIILRKYMVYRYHKYNKSKNVWTCKILLKKCVNCIDYRYGCYYILTISMHCFLLNFVPVELQLWLWATLSMLAEQSYVNILSQVDSIIIYPRAAISCNQNVCEYWKQSYLHTETIYILSKSSSKIFFYFLWNR